MTPAQVRQSPARETRDMLREIPGVELPRVSSQVSRTEEEVSIRGVGEGRTAVLLDGNPLTDAWGEWTDWNRAPKNSIDHVEVVEGGGSNLYGNGARGGVIAFYSKPTAPGSYSLTAEGGSRDYRHTYLSAGVPVAGPFSASVSGDYGQGGGYQLIATPGADPVDAVSSVITRNASARLDYAPSANLSAFVSGHFFGDNRNLGTALSTENRSDGTLNFDVNYGDSFGGTFTGRASARRTASRVRSSISRRTYTRRVMTEVLDCHGVAAMWSASSRSVSAATIASSAPSLMNRIMRTVWRMRRRRTRRTAAIRR
jgi:outer membrane cobalamin receptor